MVDCLYRLYRLVRRLLGLDRAVDSRPLTERISIVPEVKEHKRRGALKKRKAKAKR